MLNDFAGADKVYIACGYTDLRRGIDGLATIVQQQFQLDPFTQYTETNETSNREMITISLVEPVKKSEKKKPRKRRSGSIDDVIPEGTPVRSGGASPARKRESLRCLRR